MLYCLESEDQLGDRLPCLQPDPLLTLGQEPVVARSTFTGLKLKFFFGYIEQGKQKLIFIIGLIN